MKTNRLAAPWAFALAAACALGALSCAGCSSSTVEDAADKAADTTETTVEDGGSGRTLLLPDWYFNETSDEDAIEILMNAGCTNAERSGSSFAVTMPDAYAEAFVNGMKDEVQDMVDELAEEASALGATLEADEVFATIRLIMPDNTYEGDAGGNLALDAQALAAAAYVYRSAADLGPCETVVVDEAGTELARAVLPDDHERIVGGASEQP